MKYLFHSLLLLLLIQAFGTQERKQTEQLPEKAVILPREIALLAIAYQPECPIKLSYMDIRAYLNGGGRRVVKLRNEGEKPIKSYTIAHITSFGTGEELTINDRPPNEWIMPGSEITLGDPDRDQTIPFSEDISKKLALHEDPQFVSIFFVVRVKFADDSIYNDEKSYNALKQHFKKISKCS